MELNLKLSNKIAINNSQGSSIVAIFEDGTIYGISTVVNWGDISGTLSSQTDLWSALEGKLDSSIISSYATQSWVSSQGYITGISGADVSTALGYTPISATDIPTSLPANGGNASSLAGQAATYYASAGALANYYSTATAVSSAIGLSSYATQRWVESKNYITGITGAMVSTALGYTAISANDLAGYATESWVLSKNYISGISSNDVTTALGYTPLSSYTDTNQKVKTGSIVYGDNATVEFVAGGNVSITGDSATNKMTISYTTPASLPANGGNASSLNGQAATYYASAGLVSSLDYTSVGALSSGTAIPSTYGDVGAASAGHNHDGRYLSTSANVISVLGYTPLSSYTEPVNADWSATTGLSSIKNKPTLGTAASMDSTAFRASNWMPTYGDVGALSSSTFIPSVYGDVGAASAAHTHTYSDVGAASAGHNHNGTYLSNSTDISTALGFTPVSGSDLANFIPLAGTAVLQGTIQPVTQTNSIDLGASGYPFRSIYAVKFYSGTNGTEIVIPTSLPANGGNASSLAGQSGAYYASAGALANYIPLTGTTSLAGTIYPTVPNSYDIGATGHQIRSIYTRELFATFSVSTSSVYTSDAYISNNLVLYGRSVTSLYAHNIQFNMQYSTGNNARYLRGGCQYIGSESTAFTASTFAQKLWNLGCSSTTSTFHCTGRYSAVMVVFGMYNAANSNSTIRFIFASGAYNAPSNSTIGNASFATASTVLWHDTITQIL